MGAKAIGIFNCTPKVSGTSVALVAPRYGAYESASSAISG
jgi:hypothetical protein